MFVKKKYLPNNRTVVQLVQSYRSKGKSKQKIIRHVGTAHNDKELEQLIILADIIEKQLLSKSQPKLFSAEDFENLKTNTDFASEQAIHVNLKQIVEEQRIIAGIHEIYGKMYDLVGFEEAFKHLRVSKKVIKNLVLARLARAKSKLATAQMLKEEFGINHKIEQIYRSLDQVNDEVIEEIQKKTFNYTKNLFNKEVSIVFYDCTTLYFESFTQDELKSFGYSKDHKFNQSQVLLALAVTKEGLPVGYELFPGNFYEGYTMEKTVAKLKEKFNIANIVMVADSGLLNKTNLKYLRENNIDFIVGARLKNLSGKWKHKILDSKDYLLQSKPDDTIRLYDFKYSETLRLVVSHSAKRASKDKSDREKSIEKLRNKLLKNSNPKSLISNFGYQKYLKVEGETEVSIDEDKLSKAEEWDGLHGVYTNMSDAEASAVLEQYHGLWQVEESFRINKHDLLIRPVFHWTARRIKSHVALVYMSFALIRFMQNKLAAEKIRLSAEKISKELIKKQVSILRNTDNQDYYVIPSKPTETQKKIYGVFNKKINVKPSKLTK